MPRLLKSRSEKEAQGTFRPSRENRQQIAIEGKLSTIPPVGLNKEARAAWTTFVELAPPEVLTVLDHMILERWCRLYALYRKLSKVVEADGGIVESTESGTRLSAGFQAYEKVLKNMLVLERELGFTPRARRGLGVEQKENTVSNGFDAIDEQLH